MVYIGSSDVSFCLPLPADRATRRGSGVDRRGAPLENLDHSRVVSVATGAAETVDALGYGDSLVGRDLASNSRKLAAVPLVTDVHSVDVEKVLAQRPSLVIVDSQTAPSAALDTIADAGIPVVQIPTAWNMGDISRRIRAIARMFGDESRAQSLIDQCKTDVQAPRVHPSVAFLYLRGPSAVYLLGGRGSGADSLIAAAGGVDVGARAKLRPFTPITPEVMARLQPDILLVMTRGMASVGGPQGLARLAGVRQTPAAKAGRIIAVDDYLLLQFGAQTWSLVGKLQQGFADVME